MEDFTNKSVLVTGAGGITGQGILQCLLKINLRPKIIATDVSKTAAGLFWADSSFVLPHSSEQHKYLEAIKFLCQKYNISAVFPGSDGEARLLSYTDKWKSQDSVLLASAGNNIWNTTGDKLNTYLMAKKLNVTAPMTMRFSPAMFKQIAETCGAPVVLKPRKGSGNRGIYYIDKIEDIPKELKLDDYLVQEFLGAECLEYTVGCYFSKNGSDKTPNALVALRRKLLNGNTSFGEIISPQVFEEDIIKMAEYLDLTGYCNFQFIFNKDRNYFIEMNTRFSSSVSISQKANCNFVERYLLDNLKNKLKSKFRSKPGKTIIRYMKDYVIKTNEIEIASDLTQSQNYPIL